MKIEIRVLVLDKFSTSLSILTNIYRDSSAENIWTGNCVKFQIVENNPVTMDFDHFHKKCRGRKNQVQAKNALRLLERTLRNVYTISRSNHQRGYTLTSIHCITIV